MKIILVLLAVTLFGLNASAQVEDPSRFDIRIGIGTSLLGTGDMRTFMLETELNYSLTEYFTIGGGLGMGRSNSGVSETASFFQGNANMYFSPFGNSGKNDFRIGGGLSFNSISDAYISSVELGPGGQIINQEVTFDQRNALGFNIILENSYWITDKTLIGIKVFTQPYVNGDINSGILFKVGFRL